jgi:hypothetical protein
MVGAGSTLDDRCGESRQNCPVDYEFADDRARESRGEALFIGFGIAAIAGLGAGVVGAAIGLTGGDAKEARVVAVLGPGDAGAGIRITF